MAELKPCPFCGCADKRKIIEYNWDRQYRIRHACRDMIYILGYTHYETEDKVIEAWNRRADDA